MFWWLKDLFKIPEDPCCGMGPGQEFEQVRLPFFCSSRLRTLIPSLTLSYQCFPNFIHFWPIKEHFSETCDPVYCWLLETNVALKSFHQFTNTSLSFYITYGFLWQLDLKNIHLTFHDPVWEPTLGTTSLNNPKLSAEVYHTVWV